MIVNDGGKRLDRITFIARIKGQKLVWDAACVDK